ncbi:MAG TPA: hypothetical protein VHK68_04050 [Gemmatimonadales bacterium]|jgi:hypothetical protein|nr:hypothetical protein [Gemmatimonadales bacterium]
MIEMPEKAADLAEKLAKFEANPGQSVYIKWWRVTDSDPALASLGGVTTLTPGISDGRGEGFIHLWDNAQKLRRTSVSEGMILDVHFIAAGEVVDDAAVRRFVAGDATTEEELPPAA